MSIRKLQRRLTTAVCAVVVAVTIIAAASSARACPLCGESLPSNGQKEGAAKAPPLAEGYAWSIGLMLAAPLLVVASLGGAAYFAFKQAGANEAVSNSDAGPTEDDHSA